MSESAASYTLGRRDLAIRQRRGTAIQPSESPQFPGSVRSDEERARLAAVRRYHILDTAPDDAFDRITQLAARFFDMPAAVISIVGEDRVWFKSRVGLDDVREVPRDASLFASAMFSPGVNVVESAHTDELGMRFYAGAPLRTPDGLRIGSLSVLDGRPRPFSYDQQIMLASLASVVMDYLEMRLRAIHTVSSERMLRQHISELSMQTAMLPRGFPAIDNVTFDAVYVPAGNESVVGGDWYDAFLIDRGRLLLSIGDVAGHGLPAAALMGSLRQSLRAFALTEGSPAALLQLLDTMLRLEDETIVTAFVAVIDLRARTLCFANAGHPRPLLRLPDGSIQELNGTGLPLGLRTKDEPRDTVIAIPQGALLVTYTDGLTEATRDVAEGEHQLRAALTRSTFDWSGNPARALCEHLVGEGNGDDVAIMSVLFG